MSIEAVRKSDGACNKHTEYNKINLKYSVYGELSGDISQGTHSAGPVLDIYGSKPRRFHHFEVVGLEAAIFNQRIETLAASPSVQLRHYDWML